MLLPSWPEYWPQLHERDALPDIGALRARFAPRTTEMPEVQVVVPEAAVYDELLEAA